ncbi:hypothetical protein GCM10010967_13170 [Dyadobacter beijingensis]|uniref:VWFA domain-containing protein n=1 Tax=Dyadobacter beijingensis TaxID=365489 RepID=A0ABQ2HL80_9BACT|nr:hypothetical protein [Dyadobacter beijingensis]GGM82821.1 hypothetical protein GCM10010967_13170 [Dyadobacter beijingensis]
MSIERISYLFLALTFFGCGSGGSKTEEQVADPRPDIVVLNNFNVLLVPDLSNRIDPNIHPKPVHDTILLNSFVDNIKQFLAIGARKMNQKDIFTIDFMNRTVLSAGIVSAKDMQINFDAFENKPRDRSDYIRSNLANDQAKLKKEIGKLYKYSLGNYSGTDIWTYFNQTIHQSLVNRPKKVEKISDETTANIVMKNVAVIFTDGYIENANHTSGYSLRYSVIKEARDEYNKVGGDIEQFISKNPKYQIKRTTKSLKGLSVMVVEFADRSRNAQGVAMEHPNDYQIMRAIWKKWLLDSGADACEVYESVKQPREFIDNFMKFTEAISRR